MTTVRTDTNSEASREAPLRPDRGAWLRTARYLAAWLTGRAPVELRSARLPVAGRTVDADLYHPQGEGDPLRAWIVLHGLTRPGRRHRALARFARALAASGARVLIPDIPSWRALELDPEATDRTVEGALRFLEGVPGVRPDGVVLAGFSFGAPQVLRVARRPETARHLAGTVAWGGYHHLGRTIDFQLTGGYSGREPNGSPAEGSLRPDPYGRWVVAGNCLTEAYPEGGDVARALLQLAREVGERQEPADSPRVPPLVATHRFRVAPERRPLFDVFAPPHGGFPDPRAAREVVDALDGPVQRAFPLLDPGPHLGPLECPARLLHSRTDRMIPYTETVELARALEGTGDLDVTITGLFSHSGRPGGGLLSGFSEGRRFLRALGRVLALSAPPPAARRR